MTDLEDSTQAGSQTFSGCRELFFGESVIVFNMSLWDRFQNINSLRAMKTILSNFCAFTQNSWLASRMIKNL